MNLPPLTNDEKLQIEKTLKRINRKSFNTAVILSIINTIECIRSEEIKLSDWFIENIMDYDLWSYQFNVSKFVRSNSD